MADSAPVASFTASLPARWPGWPWVASTQRTWSPSIWPSSLSAGSTGSITTASRVPLHDTTYAFTSCSPRTLTIPSFATEQYLPNAHRGRRLHHRPDADLPLVGARLRRPPIPRPPPLSLPFRADPCPFGQRILRRRPLTPD